MNEMDLLARFRAEVPCTEVSPQAERRFQSALQPAGPARRSRLGTRAFPRARRLAVIAPVAAGIAAAIALTTLPGPGTNSAPVTGTVKLLADRAAAAALAWPSVRPGQWVYREIQFQMTGYQDVQPSGTESTWTTAAGTPGYVNGGPAVGFVTRAIPYSELGSLPSGPAALEKYLGDQPLSALVPGGGQHPLPRPTTPTEHATMAFQEIEGMLWDYVLPPKLAADLFRALAYIPGITARPRATDIAGRHGVAFVLPRTQLRGMSLELILNPSDYTLMALGQKIVPPSGKITPMPNGSYSGIVTWVQSMQLAVIGQAYVSRPGVLP
jgi:hypothetical protein